MDHLHLGTCAGGPDPAAPAAPVGPRRSALSAGSGGPFVPPRPPLHLLSDSPAPRGRRAVRIPAAMGARLAALGLLGIALFAALLGAAPSSSAAARHDLRERQIAQPAELFVGSLRGDDEGSTDVDGAELASDRSSRQVGVKLVPNAPAKKKTTSRRRKTTTKRRKTTTKRRSTSKRLTTPRPVATTTRVVPATTAAAPGSGSVNCPTYPISYTGGCGAAVGLACPAPYCCSSTGFCGSGEPWCGAGCQIGFGNCNAGTCQSGAGTTPSGPATTPANPEPTDPGPGTTNPPPNPTPGVCPLAYPASTDGTCGALYGRSCPIPYCCSSLGYCGLGDGWCGTGCQNGFGQCNSGGCTPGSGGGGGSGTGTGSGTTDTGSGTPTAPPPPPPYTPPVLPTATGSLPIPTVTIPPGSILRFPVQPEVGAYFTQWGVYARQFKMKKVAAFPNAKDVTFVNYAFGNIYQKDGGYECGIINRMESGNGDGGDAWSDYGMGYTTADSVDGVADKWDQPLAGNFNQLKKLKARFPKIRAFISLGGWTWSKWFSAAASTSVSRKRLVASCVDLYIRGNLPLFDGRGGPGAAAGIFDGIDIDWEYPGVVGLPYNTVSPDDKVNFNLLLEEFRYQLDALSLETGKAYGLTVALGAGRDKIDATDPAEYSKHLDWANLMSYDYNGAWAAAGPTNFQSHLYPDPASPSFSSPNPSMRYYNTKDAVERLLAAGMPAGKLLVGVPFYGRGWTGVNAGGTNGLYQPATGPAPGTYEQGIEDYRVLKASPGTVYVHNTTQQSYKYDPVSRNWWSFDMPRDIDLKVNYAKANALRGVFAWSFDGDTEDGELLARCALMAS
ncbi:glycosyl hydrolases family 18-domain-containing protein [Hyaloraphidium curvatum]|nr:glycosyl hydrolases family 18-domain-containing protein [Hyaloraphidium curvatum]